MQWCSECGVEHEDWAGACALCDAPLTSERPPPAAPTDHSLGTLTVGPLSGDQRARMTLVLQSRRVPFEFVDEELRFPESRRPDAEATLAELHADGSGEALAEAFDDVDIIVDGAPDGHGDEGDSGGVDGPTKLSSTLRRVVAELVGALMWGVALTVLGMVMEWAGTPRVAGSVTGIVVMMLVNVTLVSQFGADPGKFALGLRVVDAEDRWPRWSQALLRFVVLFGPYWLLGLVAGVVWERNETVGDALGWAPLVWTALVIWSIQHDPQRQGWHDRIARTWVVDQRPSGVRPPTV